MLSEGQLSREDGPDFRHHRLTPAETLGEVHLLLNTPDARTGPPSDAKAFKRAMRKKFGSLGAAWHALDEHGRGTLQYHEFVAACRRVQFLGNFKQVFEDLTGGQKDLKAEALISSVPVAVSKLQQCGSRSGSRCPSVCASETSCTSPLPSITASPSMFKRPSLGQLSREDGPDFRHHRLTPAETLGEVHLLLNTPDARIGPPSDAKAFKRAMKKKFGSLGAAWHALDEHGRGTLQYHEFVAACRRVQFFGNFKQVFEDLTGGQKDLKAEALVPSSPAALAKLQQSGSGSCRPSRCASEDGRGSRPPSAGASPSASARPSPGASSSRRASAGQISNEVGPEFQHGHLTIAETLGEVNLLLSRPSARTGPPSDAAGFRDDMLKKFGSMEDAWEALDPQGKGRLQYQEFAAACRRVQFSGNVKQIFVELTGVHGELRPDFLTAGPPATRARLRAASAVHAARLEEIGSAVDPALVATLGSLRAAEGLRSPAESTPPPSAGGGGTPEQPEDSGAPPHEAGGEGVPGLERVAPKRGPMQHSRPQLPALLTDGAPPSQKRGRPHSLTVEVE